MLLLTHAAMGAALYRYSRKHTSLALDRRAFVFGNILPDMHRRWLALSHRFEDVAERMDELYLEIRQSRLDGETDNEGLGILCHFLSDAFCRYHMEESLWRGSKVAHLLYEIRLHRMFSQICEEELWSAGSGWIRPGITPGEIHRELKQQFLERGGLMADNLRFALTFCVLTFRLLEEDVNHRDLFRAA